MRPYRDSSTNGPRGERGFALLAAIGLAAGVALLAAASLRESGTAARVAAGAVAAAEARAAAEAGLWRAAAAAAATGAAPSSPWTFEGVSVETAMSVERGKVDLNRADAATLATAAAAAGHPRPEAFAEAVIGARRAMRSAGISWRLDARAFDAVGQARPLAPPAVWPRLAPLLTTHGAASLDLAFAPEALRGGPPSGAAAAPGAGDVVTLRSVASTPSGARAAVEALVRIEPEGGFTTLGWRTARP